MINKFPHKYYMIVKDFLRGDRDKTLTWFHTPNPMLGMLTPLHMIQSGRSAKLIKFIESSMDDNVR